MPGPGREACAANMSAAGQSYDPASSLFAATARQSAFYAFPFHFS
jgi:hypothetical protein